MIMSIIFLLVSFSILSANVVSAQNSSKSPSPSSSRSNKTFLSSFLEENFAVLMKNSIYQIIGYPIIILVCWGPSLLYDTIESIGGSNRLVDVCNFFFPGLQGLLVALVFVLTNREAKIYVEGKFIWSFLFYHLYDTVVLLFLLLPSPSNA